MQILDELKGDELRALHSALAWRYFHPVWVARRAWPESYTGSPGWTVGRSSTPD
jgi:hypothetical protein